MRRPSFVERRDERLDESDGAVERATVAPRLERVRVGHVPVTEIGRFVDVETVVDGERDLHQTIRELEVRWRAEDGIPTQDHQEIHLATVDGRRQVGHRGRLILSGGFDRRPIGDRGADVAERLVHRVRERVHGHRLILTSDDERSPAMGLKILGDRSDPRHVSTARAGGANADPRGDLPREALDVGCAHRQPMIGLGSRERRRALDRVEPVHRLPLFGDAPPIGEVARVPHAARTTGEEVGVEREDDVRFVEVIDRFAGPPSRPAGRGARAVARHRIVLVPSGLRICGEHGGHQLGQGRRRHRPAEDPQSPALKGLLLRKSRRQRRTEVRPGAQLTSVSNDLRAIWVV